MSEGFTSVQIGWMGKWENGETPWHKTVVDRNIINHVDKLTQGKPHASVLVTWCGKSLDMLWLCSQGYSVVGLEISQVAVQQLFQENAIPFSVSKEGRFVAYQALDRELKVILGDQYEMTPETIGTFDAIWDNNAFGSSQPDNRERYVSVVASLLKPNGCMLLANWEYGDSVRDTYPYSLSSSMVKESFQEKFEVQLIGKCEILTEYFIKKFDMDWAYRNIHLLIKKSGPECGK